MTNMALWSMTLPILFLTILTQDLIGINETHHGPAGVRIQVESRSSDSTPRAPVGNLQYDMLTGVIPRDSYSHMTL